MAQREKDFEIKAWLAQTGFCNRESINSEYCLVASEQKLFIRLTRALMGDPFMWVRTRQGRDFFTWPKNAIKP